MGQGEKMARTQEEKLALFGGTSSLRVSTMKKQQQILVIISTYFLGYRKKYTVINDVIISVPIWTLYIYQYTYTIGRKINELPSTRV